MIVPGLTKTSHAHLLAVLTRVTQLSPEAVTAAFMDADCGRLAILDPLRSIRKEAYLASAYGSKTTERMHELTGAGLAATIASEYRLSIPVAAIIVGAAVGLRLGLEARLNRQRGKKNRPKLAVRVAKFKTKETDLEAARRWAREFGAIARGSERTRKKRR
jgi:hypothetical protein